VAYFLFHILPPIIANHFAKSLREEKFFLKQFFPVLVLVASGTGLCAGQSGTATGP
jgi:hypothetical protein